MAHMMAALLAALYVSSAMAFARDVQSNVVEVLDSLMEANRANGF